MLEPISFVGRKHELAQIRKFIQDWGTERVICIDGPGGIGKSRLLQEIHKSFFTSSRENDGQSMAQLSFVVTDIIDFDDHAYRFAQNFDLKIAQMLDEQIFEPYLKILWNLRKMQIGSTSPEQLARQKQAANQTFVTCFNTATAQRRAVMFWDTTDSLAETDLLSHIVELVPQLKNNALLIAGRNAGNIGVLLQSKVTEGVEFITLPPLPTSASKLYLRQKQDLLHVSLDPALARTILSLARGRPILIDLAIEWLSRAIPLDWLVKKSSKTRKSSTGRVIRRQKDFEAHLVRHITQIRTRMDRLTLAMAHVYPLNAELIHKLLKIPEDEAKQLLEEAKGYIFVKVLPDEQISLHDEMRRLINKYVWPQVDPDGHRQRRDSKLALDYLEQKIQVTTEKIREAEKKEKMSLQETNGSLDLETFLTSQALEQELWSLKVDLLKHALVVDLDEGVKRFAGVFDEATTGYRLSFRQTLVAQVQGYDRQLSPEQQYELNSRRVKYLIDGLEYAQAKELVTQILARGNLLPEQHIDMLIQQANVEVRLGSVEQAIVDFQAAIEISESNNLPLWLIKAKNGLGWVYRLEGKLDLAIEYYLEAKALCETEGVLGDVYGWILNNLTFVLAYQLHPNAVNLARATVEHWRGTGDEIGLGAAYLVLGTTYYKNGRFYDALASLQEALNIFEPLGLNYWIGQIRSERGSTYLRLNQLSEAERDLRKAIEIGPSNIKAMTLNRLGRLYLAQQEWDLAEEYFKESYKQAQGVLDFGYSFGSLAKLIIIAVKRHQYERLDEFEKTINEQLPKVRTHDNHDLGDAYFGLVALAMGQKDISRASMYLEKAVTLITESSDSYRADALTKLTRLEENFEQIDSETIRQVGHTLKDVFIKKGFDNMLYGVITPLMHRWANWPKEEIDESADHVSA